MLQGGVMCAEDWGRPNRRQAEMIDDVLRAAPDVSARAVARFLADVGVPFPVICRVINEPGRRRAQPAQPD